MSMWAEIGTAIARELALPDVDTMTTIVVRVLVAAILGGLVGWEREQRGRAAGFRDYLTKPLDIPAFARALNNALAETGAVRDAEEAA